MKKVLFLLLAIILVLSVFSGCVKTRYVGPLPDISRQEINGAEVAIELTEAQQEQILSLLNSGNWVNDLTNCGHDYKFTTDSASIRYHSACGTFNDITNGRSLSLTDEQKAEVNKILGIDA